MRNWVFFMLIYIKKLEEIRGMVKELDINYEEVDLSVLNNFVKITEQLNDTIQGL